MEDQEKLRVLLVHWVKHNREHAEEFGQWARRAVELGFKEAASELEAAVQEMKVVNSRLLTASDILGGSLEHHHCDHKN